MSKPVRVTITGTDGTVTDAPKVDDLIGQIRDLTDVLRGVERAMMPSRGGELVWRVTDARMNSPLSLELTPFGVDPTAVVSKRAADVERATAAGLAALRAGEARPAYFTDDVLPKARKLYARVLNGLHDTTIAFDTDVAESLVISPASAREVERAAEKAKGVESVPYRELGSIEGFITKPELDGYGRAILRFRARLGGAEIKAYASGEAFRQVETLRLSDVWDGARVRVYGLINYKGLGNVDCINAYGIELLDADGLPGPDDVVDPSFTGGLSSEAFLDKRRGYDA